MLYTQNSSCKHKQNTIYRIQNLDAKLREKRHARCWIDVHCRVSLPKAYVHSCARSAVGSYSSEDSCFPREELEVLQWLPAAAVAGIPV